jgi:hypothetical protein
MHHASLLSLLFLAVDIDAKGYNVKKLQVNTGGELVVDGEAAPVMYFEEGTFDRNIFPLPPLTECTNAAQIFIFDQSHESNAGCALEFTTQPSGNVVASEVTYGTSGTRGSYTQMIMRPNGPPAYHYHCSGNLASGSIVIKKAIEGQELR